MTDADGAIIAMLILVVALQVVTIRALRRELRRFERTYRRGSPK